MVTEKEILEQLDLAFQDTPSSFFPIGRKGDVRYNFFLDLEHGYCQAASSCIHLYRNNSHWAIVFEKNGYQNRAISAEIELYYVGNCIEYLIDEYPERNYITNVKNIVLIDSEEYERIENTIGDEMETFELIAHDIETIKIRNQNVIFEKDYKKYEALGIEIVDYDNPKKLISFGNLVRYLSETNPTIVSATEDEIKSQLPEDIKKIMTIKDFHYSSKYVQEHLPSNLETYQLIAKVLVNNDETLWKPTLEPNNHWSNWESGNL